MANVKDIGLSEDFELISKNGDFFIEDSDQNHIALILKSYLGAFKEFPLVGLGIDYYIASSGNKEVIKRNMTVQLNNDAFKVNEIKINNDSTYYVDAIRIS
jgi:hypothetical protein